MFSLVTVVLEDAGLWAQDYVCFQQDHSCRLEEIWSRPIKWHALLICLKTVEEKIGHAKQENTAFSLSYQLWKPGGGGMCL